MGPLDEYDQGKRGRGGKAVFCRPPQACFTPLSRRLRVILLLNPLVKGYSKGTRLERTLLTRVSTSRNVKLAIARMFLSSPLSYLYHV
jgi:hypothetical protein